MQSKSRIFDYLAQCVTGAADVSKGMKTELDAFLNDSIECQLAKKGMVTRDEFLMVKDAAMDALMEVENLKLEIASLKMAVDPTQQDIPRSEESESITCDEVDSAEVSINSDENNLPSTSVLMMGCGAMGTALLRGMSGVLSAENVYVIELDPKENLLELRDGYPFRLFNSVHDMVQDINEIIFDVIVLAVKPQDVSMLLQENEMLFARTKGVLSIIAGKKLAFFEGKLGGNLPIVRAMPNMPVEVGYGMTAMIAGNVASTCKDFINVCEYLMSASGRTMWFTEEHCMDIVTSISGSGPAYVFSLIEALASAGKNEGLSAEDATILAETTIIGAGELLRRKQPVGSVGTGSADLKRKIMSPGGTTVAAMDIIDNTSDGLPCLVGRAVAASAKRSRDMSN